MNVIEPACCSTFRIGHRHVPLGCEVDADDYRADRGHGPFRPRRPRCGRFPPHPGLTFERKGAYQSIGPGGPTVASARGRAAPAAAGTRRSAGARRRSAACRWRTRTAHQGEHQVLFAVGDGDAEPVEDVPEPGLAAVLAGEHHPARARVPVGRERPERRAVVELVVPPVLQRPVGVDARLVRERVAADPGPGRRQRLAERVRRPQPEPPGPGQVERITDRRPSR